MAIAPEHSCKFMARTDGRASIARLQAWRVTLGLVVGLVVAMPMTLGLATGSAAAASVNVSIVYRAYQPTITTIDAGDTVTWTNRGLTPHTVTATAGMFDSGRLDAGASFSVAFSTPGTFLYACTIHPTMHGEVIVRDPSSIPSGPGAVNPPHAVNVKLHVSSQPAAKGKVTLVHVQADRPGAKVLLEVSSPEHRAWRTVAHSHLSSRGKATLSLRASAGRRARVVVLGLKGEPALVSQALHRAT